MSGAKWDRMVRSFRIPGLRRIELEVDDELQFHIDARTSELVAQGLREAEAAQQARREFGDLGASRAELAEIDRRVHARERRADGIDVLRQEARYALRGIRREPGVAAGIILTLAIAVGANTAVFAMIDPLFFRVPPGLTDPAAVRRVFTVNPSDRSPTGTHVWRIFSYAEFRAIQAALAGHARVAVFASRDSVPLGRDTEASVAAVSYVTADFLPMLARVGRGRFFAVDEDDTRAPATVAVVSERFGRRHSGDSTDPVGETIELDGTPYTIVGVAADGFEGIELSAVDIWVPFSTNPRLVLDQQPWYERGGVSIPMVMRLGPAASEASVTARASLAYARVYAEPDSVTPGRSLLLGPIAEARAPITARQEVTIATRLAMVAGAVLLIACANVANLLLLRAVRRRREITVRLALGISRRRLAVQMFIEALVLGAIAGGVALIVGHWIGTALRLALLPRVDWIGALMDTRVISFALVLALLAALSAAVIPASIAARLSLTDNLAGGGHAATPRRSPVRAALLVLQTALSMILLVGASLFVRSLDAVTQVDMGFDVDRIVVASAFFDDGQRHPERASAFPDVAQRLASMPGISGVTYGSTAPLYSWYSFVPLFSADRDDEITTPGTRAEFIAISGDFFRVAGTRILQGRAFDASDTRRSPRVMVAGATMARTLWPDESPLGKCVSPRSKEVPCYTIVGIAQDVRGFRRLEETGQRFYIPFDQAPNEQTLPSVLFIRTVAGSSAAVAKQVQAELAAALPGARISSRSAESILSAELRPWRLGAILFGALGLLALTVAAIGVYSVVAFITGQRSRELGIRIALGAQATALVRMVVSQGVRVALVGIVVGSVGVLAAGRLASTLLYGVKPWDPLSIVVAGTILFVVATIACLGPALRSTRADPVAVLRTE
jgi:predicted permease